jgi:ComF family protein
MKFIARLFRRFLDILIPPLCLQCHKAVGSAHTLCPACWKSIRFIASPCCAQCGAPFDFPVEEGTLCGECLAFPPDYTKARSAMIYDDASKGLILRLKHADHLHLARGLAQNMFAAGKDLLDEADFIVPVPLHRFRLFQRRYNQAALLAQALGKLSGKPVLVDVLLRARATQSQGHLKREERRKNVAGAFCLAPRKAAQMAGKKILLVDDVMTTGATANACATALIKAGVAAVFVLTAAKTHKT